MLLRVVSMLKQGSAAEQREALHSCEDNDKAGGQLR